MRLAIAPVVSGAGRDTGRRLLRQVFQMLTAVHACRPRLSRIRSGRLKIKTRSIGVVLRLLGVNAEEIEMMKLPVPDDGQRGNRS